MRQIFLRRLEAFYPKQMDVRSTSKQVPRCMVRSKVGGFGRDTTDVRDCWKAHNNSGHYVKRLPALQREFLVRWNGLSSQSSRLIQKEPPTSTVIVGYRESLASELKDLQSGKCAGQSDEVDAFAGDPEMKCGQSVGVSQHCRTTIVARKYPRSVQPVFLLRFSPNRFEASLIGW